MKCVVLHNGWLQASILFAFFEYILQANGRSKLFSHFAKFFFLRFLIGSLLDEIFCITSYPIHNKNFVVIYTEQQHSQFRLFTFRKRLIKYSSYALSDTCVPWHVFYITKIIRLLRVHCISSISVVVLMKSTFLWVFFFDGF